jgi:hypothetical protein
VARETASVAFTRAITLRCVAAKSLITLCSAGEPSMNWKIVLFFSVYVIAAILIAVAFCLVVMNRASEKVVTTALPIMVVGPIGVILSIWFLGAQEARVTETFPTVFMYQRDSKLPANLPWFLLARRFYWALSVPAELFKQHPEARADPADPNGWLLYHHLLQRALLDWLGQTYRGTWQVEILSFETPMARQKTIQPAEPTPEPHVVSIDSVLVGNKFAGIRTEISPQIAVPPDASLTVVPPHFDQKTGVTSEIRIQNKFCTLSIETQEMSMMPGIGVYGAMAGLSDAENASLTTAAYVIRFKAEFCRWRSGDPEMPKYRQWAKQMATELKAQFDEQAMYQAAKDDYPLLKVIPAQAAQPKP